MIKERSLTRDPVGNRAGACLKKDQGNHQKQCIENNRKNEKEKRQI